MSLSDNFKWVDWLVQTNDVSMLWDLQPTFLISQAVYLFAGFVTFVHAFEKGGRWPYLWLGTVLHGLYADNFWHFVMPQYDNFWHSKTPVMFLGGRLPLHIIFLYPAFIYHAAYAVSKLNLPSYAQAFAVGLVTVLIDLPYDIVAVKFVHWTWHDTDPNIYDRHYGAPWNSYYFHATFTTSFFYIFHASRRWLVSGRPLPQWASAGFLVELKALLIATLLGMPGGVLMFVPIYHTLHDMYIIPTEVTFFVLFTIYSAITLSGLLSERRKNSAKLTVLDHILILQLSIHYIIYLVFVIWFNPENEVSVGLHEPIGPCDQLTEMITPFGQRLYKRKYLCLGNFNDNYFDFHCVTDKPKHGALSYTICGTSFENKRLEYIVVISTATFLAATVFYNIYFTPAVVQTKKKKN